LPRQQRITAIEIDFTRAAHLAMMPHCRQGGMSVSKTNFLDHVGRGPGYFGTLFNAILMTPPRPQNEDLGHVMAGSLLGIVVSSGAAQMPHLKHSAINPFRSLGNGLAS
jgi:hypothetical protein